MKKNILFIAAALFLFLGSQVGMAQAKVTKNATAINSEKIEVSAQKKTKSLARTLELSNEQQKKVYELFASTEKKMSSAGISAGVSQEEMRAKETKMKTYVNMKMKEILTEDQYTKYLEMAEDL